MAWRVLGGRHWQSGGSKRCYFIVKDGIKYYAGALIMTLSEAKELIDKLIEIYDKK